MYPLLGFLITVAYAPGWIGAAYAPRWAIMSVVIPIALFFIKPRLTVGHLLFAAFLAWSMASYLWITDLYNWQYVNWHYLLIFGAMLIAPVTLGPLFMGMAYGLAVNLVFVGLQLYGIDLFITSANPAGLFVNKNPLAEVAALVLVGLLGTKQYRLATIPTVLLALTSCRAAWLAVAVCGVLWVWSHHKPLSLALAAASLAGLVGTLPYWPLTAPIRLNVWGDTLAAVTPLGYGTGSFLTLFPSLQFLSFAEPQRFANPHNDWLQIAFENGLVGAALIASLLVYLLHARWKAEHYVLLCFMVIATFGYPLHLPIGELVLGLAAGAVCRSRAELRVSLRSGRDSINQGMVLLTQSIRHTRGVGSILSALSSGHRDAPQSSEVPDRSGETGRSGLSRRAA